MTKIARLPKPSMWWERNGLCSCYGICFERVPWFQDLAVGLAGVAPNTLSARLKTLEKQGVIGMRLYETHPPRFEYFLTDKGQALGPVLKALHKWGERYG